MLLPRAISEALDKVARSAIGRDWNLYAALLDHWTEIVGAEYAEKTTPVKISFPKGKPAQEKWAQGRRTDGVLHIRLPQGLVLDFTYRTEQITGRIATYFGYPAIERIVLEPFYAQDVSKDRKKLADRPLDPEVLTGLQKSVQNIEDGDLREALERLGTVVLSQEDLKPRR